MNEELAAWTGKILDKILNTEAKKLTSIVTTAGGILLVAIGIGTLNAVVEGIGGFLLLSGLLGTYGHLLSIKIDLAEWIGPSFILTGATIL